jgi:hypothetical protein
MIGVTWGVSGCPCCGVGGTSRPVCVSTLIATTTIRIISIFYRKSTNW